MKAQRTLNHLITAELVNSSMANSGLSPEAVLDTLRLKLKANSQLLGSYSGKNLAGIKTVGEEIVKFDYHLEYENFTLQFTFLYFNTRGGWQVQSFKIFDRSDAFLQVA